MNCLTKSLLLLLLGMPLWGSTQPCNYPQLQCTTTDNTVHCWLDWAPIAAPTTAADTCYQNVPAAPLAFAPPVVVAAAGTSFTTSGPSGGTTITTTSTSSGPTVDDNSKPPQWVFSWDMGDGHYMVGINDTIDYAYNSGGTYPISVQVRSIYSPTEDPADDAIHGPGNGGVLTVAVTNPLTPPVKKNSNFSDDDNKQNKVAKITPQLRAAQPGDEMTVAISYRQLDNDNDAGGALFIGMPKGVASIKDDDQYHQKSRKGVTGIFNSHSHSNSDLEIYRLDYDSLSLGEERTVFINLAVNSNTDVDHLELEAGIVPNYDSSVDAATFFGIQGFNNKDYNSGNAIPNPNYFPSSNQGDSIYLAINKSRDPNAIICTACIEPGQDKTLKCRVDFENLGEGDAREVIVESHYDSRLNPGTIITGLHFPKEDDVNLLSPAEVALGLITIPTKWIFDTLGLATQRLVLPSPFYAPGNNKGYVNYTVQSKPGISFSPGDKIEHRALILMDGDSLWTDYFYTKVKTEEDIKLPWYWGIRAGLNAQESFNQSFKPSGFHLGITARKALGRVDRRLKNKPFFSAEDLPEFHFLGELTLLSYQAFQNTGEEELRIWHSDVAPGVMYTPHATDGFLALHAGLLGGLRWSATVNGIKQDLSGANRLDYGLFYGLSVGNNLGSPGASLGARVQHRQAQLAGVDQNYILYQIYLHFTF